MDEEKKDPTLDKMHELETHPIGGAAHHEPSSLGAAAAREIKTGDKVYDTMNKCWVLVREIVGPRVVVTRVEKNLDPTKTDSYSCGMPQLSHTEPAAE